MNEFEVVFSDNVRNNQIFVPKMFKDILGDNRKIAIWDPKYIAALHKYGYGVVFDKDKIVHFKIAVPQELNVNLVQKHLDCFFFDHLWGETRCNFRLEDYLVDLIDCLTPIETCKRNLDLARRIKITQLHEELVFLTLEGEKMIQEKHAKCNDFYWRLSMSR